MQSAKQIGISVIVFVSYISLYYTKSEHGGKFLLDVEAQVGRRIGDSKIGDSDSLRLDCYASSSCLKEEKVVGMSVQVKESEELAVTTKDGGPAWQQVMEKTTPGFTYRAWKREPEVSTFFIKEPGTYSRNMDSTFTRF